ncbi:MAG: hypothetical protein ACQETE_11470 [Bacteroidota bacterium]
MDIDHQKLRDGTELISNFMGSTIKIDQDDVKDIPLAFLKPEDMKFHLAWKWLMPVVLKIEEELGYQVVIDGNQCTITTDDGTTFEHNSDTKMEAIWRTVVACLESE